MSKFNIGDKVRFLNSDGYGIIKNILSSNKVELENEFGFEEIHSMKNLVPVRSEEDYQTDNLMFQNQVYKKINAEKSASQTASLKKKFKHLDDYGKKNRDIIDLHVENLIDSHTGMSNAEILILQMTHFRRFLNKSIAKKHKRIVIIHGVGEGVLRHEIRKELDIYHANLEYHDASYNEFGYGATEIRLG